MLLAVALVGRGPADHAAVERQPARSPLAEAQVVPPLVGVYQSSRIPGRSYQHSAEPSTRNPQAKEFEAAREAHGPGEGVGKAVCTWVLPQQCASPSVSSAHA